MPISPAAASARPKRPIKDSLTIYSEPAAGHPEARAGRDRAQGKNDEAVAFLEAGRGVLDAVRLRPRAGACRPVRPRRSRCSRPRLASRAPTRRVRQNLALAHALAGDWTEARTIAAQDVPADQLDGRIQQWMQLASPKHAGRPGRGAVGVTPAAVDAGQPVRLALSKADTLHGRRPRRSGSHVADQLPPRRLRAAAAAALALPQRRRRRQPPAPVRRMPAPRSTRPGRAVAPARASPRRAPTLPSARRCRRDAAAAAREVPAPSPRSCPRSAAAVRHAKPAPRRGSPAVGNVDAVVQLGAYRLAAARARRLEQRCTKRYPRAQGLSADERPLRLARRAPSIACRSRASPAQREAIALLQVAARRSGGSCFVRNFAGDAPVQIASR